MSLSACLVCRSETRAGTGLVQPKLRPPQDPTLWNSRLSLPRKVGIGFNAWITLGWTARLDLEPQHTHRQDRPPPCLSSLPPSASLASESKGKGPLAAALERLVITRQHGSAASYSCGIRRRKPQRAPSRLCIRKFTYDALDVGARRLGGRGESHLPACLPGRETLGEPTCSGLPHHLQLSR